MRAEFLSYKYEGVRTIGEISDDPVSFGWKCRKYIRWKQVHNDETDRDVLRFFADGLIEKNELNPRLYGAISRIFYNVQRWRLDKEELSIEPPYRKEWIELHGIARVARQSPSLILEELRSQNLLIQSDTTTIQSAFFLHLLNKYLTIFSGQKFQQIKLEGISSVPEEEFLGQCHESFSDFYSCHGLKFDLSDSLAELISGVFDDLGIEGIELDSALEFPSNVASISSDHRNKAVISYCEIERFQLLSASSSGNILHLRLNSNHPYVKSLSENKELKMHFEEFFKAYVLSIYEMPGYGDVLSDFSAYLGLWLYRFHKEQKTGGSMD